MSTRNRSSDFKKGMKVFVQHVESLEKSDDGFIKEYSMIQEAQMRSHGDSSMDIGKLEQNLKKNRYKDIVPYDEYRIVLSHCEGDECSDYINASKIMGVSGAGDYIASQGPLSGTVNDFWRMIWEYDVEIVFMACRLVEMEKVKCSQYWADVGSSVEFGSITVSTVSEEEIFTECTQRILRVMNGNEVHNVTQLHYRGWPDHGIPKNPDDIRDAIGIMRRTRQNCKAPLLVHCSAGCGRTGTIIAIDYVWTLLENGIFDETFSLFDLICNFRKQRVSLVQTPDQYALVNKVLKSLCEEMLAKIASHIYENVQLNQEQSNDGGNQQRQKKPPYHDSKQVSETIIANTVTTKTRTHTTQVDSPQSSRSVTPEKNSKTLAPRSLPASTESSTVRGFKILTPQTTPASTESSTVRGFKTLTPRSLPVSTESSTVRGFKTLTPRSVPASTESSTVRGFKKLTPQTPPAPKENSTVRGFKTLTPQSLPASTEINTERRSKTSPRSSATAEISRISRTLPRASPSNNITTDEIRRQLQMLTSRQSPAHFQMLQESRENPTNNRRWSSVKSQRTAKQTTDSPRFENSALAAQSKRVIVPTNQTRVRVSAGNTVYNFSRQPENRSMVVRSVQGTRGTHSSTAGSEIQTPRQMVPAPKGKLQQVPSAGPPVSPTYKGYVLLTSGSKPTGEGRGGRHK